MKNIPQEYRPKGVLFQELVHLVLSSKNSILDTIEIEL